MIDGMHRGWFFGLIGSILAIVWVFVGGITAVWQPIIDTDLNQHRLDVGVVTPRNERVIQQQFVPRWDGLSEVELLLIRYGDAEAVVNGRLTFQLLDDANSVVAEETLETAKYEHNQVYKLAVPVQRRSAGRTYTLQISGNAHNNFSVWGYTLNTYDAGRFTISGGDGIPESEARTLRFTTRYQLGWSDALASLGTILFYEGIPLLLALLVVPLPGLLLLQFLRRSGAFLRQAQDRLSDVNGASEDANPSVEGRAQDWDGGAFVGTAVALGLSIWPILWFWLTMIGGSWAGWSLWLLVIAGWSTLGWLWWQSKPDTHHALRITPHLPLILLLVLALVTRLLAVRDISFAPWVDASRHGLITAVMSHSGRIPITYAPFLPVDQFPYHFGFHALASSLHLMSGWPLERLLLYLGQLLNGLMPLMVYTAVWHLIRRRWAALFAAFLVAFPFFFPGYYATWGRFTQLTAMLVMPVLLATTWLLLQQKGWQRAWWIVGILAAGLSYIHFRVFLFYLPFVIVAGFVTLGQKEWWRRLLWLLAGGSFAILLAGPRLWQLWRMDNPTSRFSVHVPGYNAFPTSYITTGWEQYYLWAFALGLLGTIVWVFWSGYSEQRSWAVLPITLAAWVAILFLLLAGERIGLPETAVVNTNSMYITLFIPLAFFLALVLAHFWEWWRQYHWLFVAPAQILFGATIALLFLFGVRQQINILNPQTILAETDDLVAVRWLDENLPDDARIAVNSWRWLGSTWAGSDGGAWLLPLTGRATSTPPVDYIYNVALFEKIIAFNQQATAVDNWHAPEQADWLREQGYTHIFVGTRGGFFDPAALARNPQLDLIFRYNGVFIFEIQ